MARWPALLAAAVPALALLAAWLWPQQRGASGQQGPKQDPWSRKPCADAYKPCQDVGCCSTSGFWCAKKNDRIAVCVDKCKAGVNEHDPPELRTPWSCEPHPPCAGAFQPCMESKCCRNAGFSCYQKDESFAQCRRECTPGLHAEDPTHWRTPWTCARMSTTDVPAAPQQGKAESLYVKGTPVMNKGAVECRDQTPDMPGEPSELASYPWFKTNTSCKVSAEDIAAYDRDGFVILRGVLEKEPLDVLHEQAKEYCKKQLDARGVCQIEQVRWQVNIFRDFIYYSSLGCLMHAVIRGSGVRVQSEGLFGLQYNEVDPMFFSYRWHTDQSFKSKGVYHGFPTGTKAASVWFPMHDLDPNTTGGSVSVVRGYPQTDCRHRACGGLVVPSRSGPSLPESCKLRCLKENACTWSGCFNWDKDNGEVIPQFRKGDVVIWHSDMPHRTQRVAIPNFHRYSFTVRFVESDAVVCDPAVSCGGPMGCCQKQVSPGEKAHTPCYPQVYPKVLDHELAEHYSSEPKTLIATMERERSIWKLQATPECASGPP